MRWWNQTCKGEGPAVRFCQIARSTASPCRVLSIPQVGRKVKWKGVPVDERPARYAAYLLRCWEVRSDRPGQPSSWRFSLEQAGTGERRGFRDLEALAAHLEAELGRGAAGLPQGG